MANGLQLLADMERAAGGEWQHGTTECFGASLKKKLVGMVRCNHGRLRTTSLLIIDAQSVKNTSTAKHKGYDGGKKVSGIKRHIAVDTLDYPMGYS